MKSVLVVDAQKFFLRPDNESIFQEMYKYLKSEKYENYLYLRRVSGKIKTPLKCKIIVEDLKEDDLDFVTKKVKYAKVFSRKYDTMCAALKNFLRRNNVTEVDICGVNTNKALDLIVTELNCMGIRANLIKHLICNVTIGDSRDMTPEEFFISKERYYLTTCYSYKYNIINGKPALPTVLTIATMDWLLNTNKTQEDFKNKLIYYCKFNKNQNFSLDFCRWIDLSCRNYRTSDEDYCLYLAMPIAWYCETLEEIDEMVYRVVEFISNNEKSFIATKFVAYMIWQLKNKSTKLKSFTRTVKIFNFKKFDEISKDNHLLKIVKDAFDEFYNAKSLNELFENLNDKYSNEISTKSLAVCFGEIFYQLVREESAFCEREKLPKNCRDMLTKFETILYQKKNVKIKMLMDYFLEKQRKIKELIS